MIRKMIDMHCHILPGVDDGAATRKEVQEMLKMEYENGVRGILLTPHYRKEFFETDIELLKKRFRYVKYEVENMGLDMKVFWGCEYHANTQMVEELKANPYFRINGGKYVLVEFSSLHQYAKVRDWIYQLVSAGFKPIIAHMERYPKVTKKVEQVQELVDLGAYIQISSGALIGEDGIIAQWVSRNLLKKELVHFVASDAHNTTDRKPNMKKCAEYLEKTVGKKYAEILLVHNPRKILMDKD